VTLAFEVGSKGTGVDANEADGIELGIISTDLGVNFCGRGVNGLKRLNLC
jgi:hypothetical protein